MRKTIVCMIVVMLATGCTYATRHKKEVQDDAGEKLTVGKVQREIRVGMSGAEVVEALGSPNMVSTDAQRREVWVYDKVATDTVYSSSSGSISALMLGWDTDTDTYVSGNIAPGYKSGAGATSRSQRTLTIIVKFDDKGLVRDFAYHSSKF